MVRTLLQKESLDQCSLQELRQFADRHPYFGAAQLLLTKKLQTEDPGTYNEQLQKTFLFFNNPLWVEQLLNENGRAEIIPAPKEETEVAPLINSQTLVTTGPNESLVQTPEIINQPVVDEIVQPHDLINQPVDEIVQTAEEKHSEKAEPENIVTGETEVSVPTLKIEQAENTKSDLIFEPFHTVDYFASQGIRMKEDEKPTDKFGQQLKSFTEWLKAMKKLPVSEVVAKTEPIAEKKIEEMAEISLKEREVLTEAMAEVWEKQGNATKAIAIYDKLSLLEPSKSAYFAAKIEELKKKK